MKFVLFVILTLMSVSVFSQSLSGDETLKKELAQSMSQKIDKLYWFIKGYGDAVSLNSQEREKICKGLGEIKGLAIAGNDIFSKINNDRKSYPFDLADHLLALEIKVDEILNSCGSNIESENSLLSNQIKYYELAIDKELGLMREAVAGKKCTSEILNCP